MTKQDIAREKVDVEPERSSWMTVEMQAWRNVKDRTYLPVRGRIMDGLQRPIVGIIEPIQAIGQDHFY